MNREKTPFSFAPAAHPAATVIVAEDALALSRVLKQRIEAETGATVILCKTLLDTQTALSQHDVTLALTGFELADAPDGKILQLLAAHNVPTILFSSSLIEDLHSNYARFKLVDYILKQGPDALDIAVKAVSKVIANQSVSVLVVDDAKAARSDLVGFLHRQNFRVVEANTGCEALRRLEDDSSIDLVITDYRMPDMDGYELTKRMRETHDSDRLRIIGVSASSDRALSAQFLKAGASDFLYRPFVPEELQCRIANTVETLLQLKRLRHLAEHDPLTSLFNRRAFFDKADLHSRRLSALGGGAIAVLDIDHFKRINDTFGHERGDRVLKAVGDILMRMAQTADFIAARIGGEEFALLFPDMSMDEAEDICEQVLVEIRECQFGPQEAPLAITASIGLSGLHLGESLDNQLNAADQMLYLAKSGGRNQIYSETRFSNP